jgi:hypothetical protein
MAYTITEALAELKLIKGKLDKKATFIVTYLGRQDGAKDPLEKQGGAGKAIAEGLQATNDLHERFVRIRSAIAAANAAQTVTIGTTTRSVADWLVWRREVAPLVKAFHQNLTSKIGQIRSGAKQQGWNVVKNGEQPAQPTDVIIEIDEKALAEKQESVQEILDTLDGKLSLHNATVTVGV